VERRMASPMFHKGSTHLVSSSYSVLEVKKSIFKLIFTSYNGGQAPFRHAPFIPTATIPTSYNMVTQVALLSQRGRAMLLVCQ